MKKKYFLLMCFVTLSIYASGQSTNFKAQGKYYSAKEQYEAKNFKKSLEYIYESKVLLNGTNERLQYLHVLAAYGANRYEEAKDEMEVFFNIQDNQVEPVEFTKGVDHLTSDEVRALTMIIDKIDEGMERVAIEQQHDANLKREREAFSKNLAGTWEIVSPSDYRGITIKMNQLEDGSLSAVYINPPPRSLMAIEQTKKIKEDEEYIYYKGGWFGYNYWVTCNGKSELLNSSFTSEISTYLLDKTNKTLSVTVPKGGTNQYCQSVPGYGSLEFVFKKL